MYFLPYYYALIEIYYERGISMEERKYFTEFGLNVFTSFKTIVPVEHLEKIPNDKNYHIYGILSCPKITVDEKSLSTSKNGISCTLLEHHGGELKRFEYKDVIILQDLDHSKIHLKSIFPFSTINVENGDHNFLDKNKNVHKSFEFDAQLIHMSSRCLDKVEFEVHYIGQSFGKDGERNAFSRLKAHSTLQKILTDFIAKRPDRRLYILLLEFTTQLMSLHDGLTGKYSTTSEENDKHTRAVLCDLPRNNQVINITEAALINYFKPEYNVNFVDNFPNKDHKGYVQYYNLDYNALTVELDLEFDMFPMVQLYTESNRINSSFDMIKFNLYNDSNRTSMYDIFSSSDK